MNPWNTIFPPDYNSPNGEESTFKKIISIIIIIIGFLCVIHWAYIHILLWFIKWLVIGFASIMTITALIGLVIILHESFIKWKDNSLLGWKLELSIIIICLIISLCMLYYLYLEIKPHIHITIN